jgi:hypothetical protein
MELVQGLADQSVSFAAWTTATGAPVTVTSTTAGLSLWYRRGVVGAKVAITPIGDLATLETTHTDKAILVVEGAEHRLDLPDAATAAGVDSIQWGGTATGIMIDGGVANLRLAQSGDSYAYLGTNLGALGANATEAGGTGDQLTELPKHAATIAAGDIATDAITAAALKADAVTEIQSGLARVVSETPNYHVITPGATSRMIEVPMRSVTTGLLVAGLAYDEMTIYYIREGAATPVQCSSIQDGSAGTWSTQSWCALGGPAGIYQFGIPNAALEAGANAVTFIFSHASAATTLVRILLATVQTGDNYARLGAPAGASIAADIAGISASGDPWLTALPGSYASGTAGYIIGGFSASSDPWGVELPGSYTGVEAGKVLADLSVGVNVVEWLGATPAALANTDKVQASVQHVADGLLPSTSDIANASAAATATELGTGSGFTSLATAASLTALAGKFTGITALANWLRGMARKDTMDSTAKSEINSGGGAFDEATDSVEAIRDTAPLGTAMRGTDGANTVTPLDAAGIRSAIGMAAANLDTQIDNIEVGGGTGTGARTVTITVDDGTTALESARVRLTKGAETYVGSTDVSGEITFNVDDGTWVVAISLANYTYSPAGTGNNLVVDGDETATYSMTQTTFTASDPGFVTGYCYAKNTAGVAVEGAEVHLQMESPLSTSSGTVWDGAIRTVTSDANGLVEFTNMVPGATYRVRRGDGNWQELDVESTATDPLALPDFVGEDG